MGLLDILKPKVKRQPRECRNNYHLAGVTFKNDDGTKRQELIKEMKDNDKVIFEKYIYEGKDAIRVLNEKKQCIGNIKAAEVPYVLNRFGSIIKCVLYNKKSFMDETGKTIYTADVVVHFWQY